jgi:hypothetical protein
MVGDAAGMGWKLRLLAILFQSGQRVRHTPVLGQVAREGLHFTLLPDSNRHFVVELANRFELAEFDSLAPELAQSVVHLLASMELRQLALSGAIVARIASMAYPTQALDRHRN